MRSSWRLPERARLDRPLEFGAELEQLPAQPILGAGALPHQILSMVAEKPDLHRVLIERRGGKALHAVLDHGAGDGERIDLVRLARHALPAAGGAHPVRRHAHDPLAGRDQGLLEPPRDMPTVLNRPHPLVVQPARPTHRRQMPLLVGLDLAGAAPPAGPRVDGRQRVRALVRVRPDHDHPPPSLRLVEHRRSGSPADRSHSGRCHAPIRSHRRSSGGGGRHNLRQSDQPVDKQSQSQPAAKPENQPQQPDLTAQTQATLTVTAVSRVHIEAPASDESRKRVEAGVLTHPT